MRFFTRLTAAGAARRLALSFYPAPDLPGKDIVVVPPLLRQTLLDQPLGQREPFFLIYVLNSGYADAIIAWHAQNQHVRLHCFWDRTDVPAVHHHNETLTFHHLDGEKFLSMMARCSGLICTAGFESVCEAMYLGKPVLMVPVEGHFEQSCNAVDAKKTGAGISSNHFAIDQLIDFLPQYESPAPAFRDWVAQAEARFIGEIEAAARPTPYPAAIG